MGNGEREIKGEMRETRDGERREGGIKGEISEIEILNSFLVSRDS